MVLPLLASWIPEPQICPDLSHIGPPLIAVYLTADVGSIAGGWISSALLSRGIEVTRARKTALLICALAVTPVMGLCSLAGTFG